MLRNLGKYYLIICCKQSSSTHFCHFLATAFVADVLAGSNPMRWAQKRKAPSLGAFSFKWWAMRGVRVRLAPPAPRFVASLLACCAGKRLRVSSAPHPCGFESLCTGPKKERPPSLGAFSIKWWAMRGVRVRLAPPAPRFVASLLACCAGKRLRVSSAPHPCGFESLCTGPKKERPPSLGAFSIKWWAMRDSNPQPCACKAPALTVAPIARRD